MKKAGTIILWTLGLVLVYVIISLGMPIIRDGWSTANASANITTFTGMKEYTLIMPLVSYSLPFAIYLFGLVVIVKS